ncbi:hypothetical protein H0N99_04750 [Candidatus Micrarchaeota archaeon]|nr:hypothetical protein [Candidatus Micrarchaeota archaeon]
MKLNVEQKRAKADNLLNELMKDKETLDYLAKKIIQMNLADKFNEIFFSRL